MADCFTGQHPTDWIRVQGFTQCVKTGGLLPQIFPKYKKGLIIYITTNPIIIQTKGLNTMSDTNNFDAEIEYLRLRQEYNNPTLRTMIKNVCGSVCYNCGSTENVEYHHIVPLKLGGTNNFSNIAVLCNRCHKAAHRGQHISKYANHEHCGRKPKEYGEDAINAVGDYINCKIGMKECKSKIGLSKGMKLSDLRIYKQYLIDHNIKEFRNNIDILLVKRGKIVEGKCVGYITYVDGSTEYIKFKPFLDFPKKQKGVI